MKSFKAFNIFIFSGLFLLSISCTKKEPDTASVQLYIDQDIIPALNAKSASSNLQKIISIDAANIPDDLVDSGPEWGLPSPANYNANGCFALYVHANEPGMMERACLTETSDRIVRFGPAAGLFSFNEPVQIDVTAGSDRTFYLLYMDSSTGDCQNTFSQNNFEIDHTQYSAPHIVGSTTINLSSGNNNLSIDMSTTFSDSNKIKTCNFMEKDDSTDTPHLSFDPYESKRTVWITDNSIPRMVDFSSNGSQIECAPVGSIFGACATDDGAGNGSFEWSTDLYANGNDYRVRVTMDNGDTEIFRFNPATHYSGITWETCDETYTTDASSLTSLSTLGTFLGSAGNVICFKMDNLTDSSGSNMNVSFNDTKLIVPQGYNTLYSKTGQSNIYISASVTGSYIAGFNLVNSDGSGPHSTLYLNAAIDGTLVEDITSTVSAGPNYGVYATGNTATAPIIRNSALNHSNGLSSGYAVNAANSAQLELDKVTINTNVGAITINGDGTSVTVKDSIIQTDSSNSATSFMFKAFSGGDFYIKDSILLDGSGQLIDLGSVTGETYNIELSGNAFEKTTSENNGSFIVQGGTMNNVNNVTIYSTTPNTYCSHALGTYDFDSSLVSISPGYNGTPPANPWPSASDVNYSIIAAPSSCP